ncbi:MAG: delta-60 repeat domain-containing protein, partial [Acidobacteria bacterium]|nr:delta-60 repeat domain-containing protein [Acidobacteriota bacterium]
MKPSRFAVLFSLSVLLVLVAGLAGAPASQAQDVQVTSADPPAAEQGTITLDVTIKGKGFKNGALAKWFVTGTTNPGGVTVNSTTFISGSELRANITVADDATIASFDILVTNTNGRSGKGTELFAVVAKGSLNGSSIDACTNRAWTAPSLSPIVNYCPASGAGCLDPSFGSGGVLYPGIAGNLANLWAAAFQTDPVTSTQKMLIGGQDNAYQAVVSRIGLDGQMDPTFGVSGMAVVSPQTTPVSDYVRDIAVQADGKILAIWGFGIFRVTRLNANGSLDTAFGAGGHAAVSNFGSCAGLTSNAVDVQSDGKIVMAGGSTDCGWTLARLNSNGTLDSTFGNGGTVLYKPQSKGPGAGSVGASTVTIQNVSGEDRILAAGTSSLNKKGLDFGLARFRSNGT